MLFLLYVLCSVIPVIGHILVGLFMSWSLVGTILGLQLLTIIPILGPLIAIFVFGWPWAIGIFVIQGVIFSNR
jgi:hypothetical protein